MRMGRATILPGEGLAAGGRVALRFEGRCWTYDELAGWVEAEAAGLRALGVGAGDRVAVLALNHPRTLVLLFACERVGAMLVPLNWRLAAAEIGWILGDCQPRVLVTDGVVGGVDAGGALVVGMEAAIGAGLPRSGITRAACGQCAHPGPASRGERERGSLAGLYLGHDGAAQGGGAFGSGPCWPMLP